MTFVTKVHTIVLHRRGIRCRMTSTPVPRRGKSIRSSRFVGTKGKAGADPEDGTHLFLLTDNPAVDRMDARMEVHGVPKLLVEAGDHLHPTTMLEAGDHLHPTTMVEAGVHLHPATTVRAGAPLDPAMLVEAGVPLSQEVVGDSPRWWNATITDV
jgi:hypothetical protein